MTPDSAFMADYTEGGVSSIPNSTITPGTVIAHGRGGKMILQGTVNAPASGCEGCNFGTLDGSVSWRNKLQMRQRYIDWSGGVNQNPNTTVPGFF